MPKEQATEHLIHILTKQVQEISMPSGARVERQLEEGILRFFQSRYGFNSKATENSVSFLQSLKVYRSIYPLY